MLGRAPAGTGAVMLGAKASAGVAARAGRVGPASIAADAMQSAGMMANAVWIADLVAVNAPGIARGWGPAPRVAAAQASDMPTLAEAPDLLPLAEAPDLPAAAQAADMAAKVAAIVAER